ncbi:hypothetical protein vseg_002786 [Gypsophila vaccaria]
MQSRTVDFSQSTPLKSKNLFHDSPIKKTHPSSPSSTSMCPVVSTPDRINPSSQARQQNVALHRSLTRAECRPEKVQPLSQSQLPQKYDILCELFNALVSSIRLLRLKRVATTFTKLSRSIESLTNRRFTSDHLAQLKYIVPEIIVVKKVRVQDKETRCMKEDLHISLEVNNVVDDVDNNTTCSGGYSHLRRIFRTRIDDFATIHPEDDDVPKYELPDLFYKPMHEVIEPSMDQISPLKPNIIASPSFKRHFSHKAATTPKPLLSTTSSLTKPATPVKDIYVGATPVKGISTPKEFVSTPPTTSTTSTPARLMIATPSLTNTRKRPLVNDDLQSKSLKRRALKFDDETIDVEVHKDLQEVLPAKLLHSLINKERKTLEENDPIVLQAQRRQVLMSGVPKLFHMIQLLFQSSERSVMTEHELVHKIIIGHLDIIDKGEVEEQLKLLQELAPEFITRQQSFNGDTLLRINKCSCVDSIRTKLLEAC